MRCTVCTDNILLLLLLFIWVFHKYIILDIYNMLMFLNLIIAKVFSVLEFAQDIVDWEPLKIQKILSSIIHLHTKMRKAFKVMNLHLNLVFRLSSNQHLVNSFLFSWYYFKVPFRKVELKIFPDSFPGTFPIQLCVKDLL